MTGYTMTSSNGNIFRVTGHLCGEFPHKGQWRGTLMFTLICNRINGWVNNCEAGDLRRNHAHYDVIVMTTLVVRVTPSRRYAPCIIASSQGIWNFKQQYICEWCCMGIPTATKSIHILTSTGYFTVEVYLRSAKPPLKSNGSLPKIS